MTSIKNVLITGGSGFIGSRLALQLVKKGYEVTILDNLSLQIHGSNPDESVLFNTIKDKTKFIHGTVNSREDWMRALESQQIIVHLAAETGTGQSMYEIERYNNVNIGGTALMLDILSNSAHRIEKIVVASSRSIYGEGKYFSPELGYVYPSHRKAIDMEAKDFDVKYSGTIQPLTVQATDEESKIHPSSVYGITKQVQEQLIMTVCPTIGIAPISFRYQNVYGPGQSLSNPYTGILSIFSTLIKQGKELNIFEDGLESRDFIFIDDVVTATILGIEKDTANNEVFNVGYGQPTTVLQVAKALVKAYEKDVPLRITGNYRIGDIRHNYADLKKIHSLLGFSPSVSFDDGIKIFCDWVNAQEKIPESLFDVSIQEMKVKGLLK